MNESRVDLHVNVNKYGSLRKVYDTVGSNTCEITIKNILIADLKQNQSGLYHIGCYLIKNSKEMSV